MEKLLEERIKSMYQQGYGITTIVDVTECRTSTIKKVLGDLYDPMRNVVFKSEKRGKYDHLFEERTSQGKMYNEYLK
jgi:hypothetical protein